jgi:hypothetical protein
LDFGILVSSYFDWNIRLRFRTNHLTSYALTLSLDGPFPNRWLLQMFSITSATFVYSLYIMTIFVLFSHTCWNTEGIFGIFTINDTPFSFGYINQLLLSGVTFTALLQLAYCQDREVSLGDLRRPIQLRKHAKHQKASQNMKNTMESSGGDYFESEVFAFHFLPFDRFWTSPTRCTPYFTRYKPTSSRSAPFLLSIVSFSLLLHFLTSEPIIFLHESFFVFSKFRYISPVRVNSNIVIIINYIATCS